MKAKMKQQCMPMYTSVQRLSSPALVCCPRTVQTGLRRERGILSAALSDSRTSADRPRTLRSRITNGTELLANVDGRTAAARRYRDLTMSFADELGGVASLTEAQRALVRQAAAMIVQSENLQGQVLRREFVDTEQLTRLANAATRILSRLALKRQRRAKTPSLADYAAAKASQRESGVA